MALMKVGFWTDWDYNVELKGGWFYQRNNPGNKISEKLCRRLFLRKWKKSSRILGFFPSDSSNERCNSKLHISYSGSNRKGWPRYGSTESVIGAIALRPFNNQISLQPQPEWCGSDKRCAKMFSRWSGTGSEVIALWSPYQSILKQMRSLSCMTQQVRCPVLCNWVPDITAEASIDVLLWKHIRFLSCESKHHWKWGWGMPAGSWEQVVLGREDYSGCCADEVFRKLNGVL